MLNSRFVGTISQVEDHPRDFSLENDYLTATFGVDGFLKAITLKTEDNLFTVPVSISFVKYVQVNK